MSAQLPSRPVIDELTDLYASIGAYIVPFFSFRGGNPLMLPQPRFQDVNFQRLQSLTVGFSALIKQAEGQGNSLDITHLKQVNAVA